MQKQEGSNFQTGKRPSGRILSIGDDGAGISVVDKKTATPTIDIKPNVKTAKVKRDMLNLSSIK